MPLCYKVSQESNTRLVETLEHLVYKCKKAGTFWLDIQTWIKTLGFHNYILDVKAILLGELRGKYKLLNIIILATKMVSYSNGNKPSRLILDQVKLVLRHLFHIVKYWAETNDKVPNFLWLRYPGLYNELLNL